MLGAFTSITSTACSRARSSRFLISKTAFFKVLSSLSMNSWSKLLDTASVCFLAESAVVAGWAYSFFADGSDEKPPWIVALLVGLLVVV